MVEKAEARHVIDGQRRALALLLILFRRDASVKRAENPQVFLPRAAWRNLDRLG